MGIREELAPQRQAELRALFERADYLTNQAAHCERESLKLQRWRANRVAQIKTSADRAAATRTTVDLDADDIAYSWGGSDVKLAEYSGGMAIVERRAQMYAAMAADVRLQIQIHIMVFPESIA